LVCLGWGEFFPDKMIAFDQYDQRRFIFIQAFSPNAPLFEIDQLQDYRRE
jgi:hypothetical protein